jgi:Tol biopolymer transport system component/DNA-binding winged helix-turn-helix (wHTH) protein
LKQPIGIGYAFGEFCLDVGERRLLRSGAEVALSPKVFDTLALLVENAGHLIEKDEFMRRLWPDTFVGDDALARNISTLRKSLGESGDSQALIETVPTRGYRFVAAVRQISLQERSGPMGEASKPIVEGLPVSRSWLRRATFIIVALGLGLLAGLVTFWLLSPVPGARVRSITQITHSGRVEAGLRMASDGSRIYFLERYGDHWNLMQTSVAGGEPQPVAAPFRNTWVMDVSPDGTNLLIASFARGGERNPLWTWPVQGGAPKRIGEITAYHAAWYPNGRQILYTEDDGIYQIDADGTNARKFAGTDGIAANLRWSPDGRRLCFFTYRPQVEGTTMWEINSDGTHLHRLLPGWGKPTARSLGFWTADGRYFVFESMYSEKQDIWAMREERSLFRRQAEQPARLTAGPLNYGAMLAGKDGHTVFVTGADWRNELVRYDLPSGQFHPFLPDLHTIFMSYSQDGVWLAYVRENSVLARMKFDGTQPLDLIPPGLRIWDPRWSPDGRQILFTGLTEKGQKKIFLVSSEGGTPRELFADNEIQEEASWSPDGKFIAFVSSGLSPASAQVVHVLNLATKELAVLPGSRDMNEPIWSPDGRFLATVANDGQQLMLLDLRTQKWTQLAKGTLLYRGPFAWSRDSKYVYCQDILAPSEPVYRIRVSDRQQELVTTFETFLRGGVQRAAVIAVDPDGSPIAVLRRNAADIYALDLDLP